MILLLFNPKTRNVTGQTYPMMGKHCANADELFEQFESCKDAIEAHAV